MQKILAYRHSQEVDGKRVKKEEVEIVDRKTDNGVTTYTVKTQDGIKCTAIIIFSRMPITPTIFSAFWTGTQTRKAIWRWEDKSLDMREREFTLLDKSTADMFGIYQIKHGDNYRDYMFEPV